MSPAWIPIKRLDRAIFAKVFIAVLTGDPNTLLRRKIKGIRYIGENIGMDLPKTSIARPAKTRAHSFKWEWV